MVVAVVAVVGGGQTGAGRARPSLNVVPITAFIMGLSSAVSDPQQPPIPCCRRTCLLYVCVSVCVRLYVCMRTQSILISAGSERSTECEVGPSGWKLLLVKM